MNAAELPESHPVNEDPENFLAVVSELDLLDGGSESADDGFILEDDVTEND
jgi:hypothetical protein